MADFCNKCHKEMFGTIGKPDIDVYEISSNLRRDTYVPVLCEGCEMVGIIKDNSGNIFLLYEEFIKDAVETKKIPLKDWEQSSPFMANSLDNLRELPGIQLSSPSGEYVVKIVKGGNTNPQKYHVIRENNSTGENEYAYLTASEISRRHNVDVVSKIEKLETR